MRLILEIVYEWTISSVTRLVPAHAEYVGISPENSFIAVADVVVMNRFL